MIRLPPGEPTTAWSLLLASSTMVGAMELRGRLPASTRLAMGLPSSVVAKEKSVSSLLSRKPPLVMILAPKPSSMVVVMDTALPLESTMDMWLVPNSTPSEAPHRKVFWNGGSPGLALPMDLAGSIIAARLFREPGSGGPLPGTRQHAALAPPARP